VSVVIASSGDSPGLGQTLARTRAQVDAAGGELILVLNRRRSEIADIRLGEWSQLAQRLLFEDRPGKSRALNLAVREARAGICAFVDDDALPEQGWLEALLGPLRSDPGCAGVGGRVLPVWPAAGVPRWYRRLCSGRGTFFLGPRHDLGDAPLDYSPQAIASLPFGANCAWRRALLLEVGYAEDLGPNRETGTRGGEDALLARTLLDRGHRVVYVPSAIVHHPVAPERMTARYVLEGYYWQGVERARIQHHLGSTLPPAARRRAVCMLWRTAPFALLEPLLSEGLRVRLLRRRARSRGVLDELARLTSGAGPPA